MAEEKTGRDMSFASEALIDPDPAGGCTDWRLLTRDALRVAPALFRRDLSARCVLRGSTRHRVIPVREQISRIPVDRHCTGLPELAFRNAAAKEANKRNSGARRPFSVVAGISDDDALPRRGG